MPGLNFAVGGTTMDEAAEFYDAIFCLGVLCHGYLTNSRAQRSDPLLPMCRLRLRGRGFLPAAS